MKRMIMFNFNSIKVRLERARPGALVGIRQFQFHKGTIRTHKQIIAELKDTNFNSIKVRLEQLT